MSEIILRDYQVEAKNVLREMFTGGHRKSLIVLPTASGKTVFFVDLTRATVQRGKTVTILVHRQELLQQTSDTLFAFGVDHSIIAPGSKVYNTPVQVAMIQTLNRRLDKWEKPDLLICDEAHLSRAKTWKNVIDSTGGFVLGVTATPCRLDGKPLGDIYSKMWVGPSTGDMIKNGYLSKFVVYRGSAPDTKNIKISMGNYNQKELNVATDNKQLIGDSVEHYRDICDGEPAIAFCTSIVHAEHTAEMFNSSGYKFKVLHGELDKKTRNDIIKELSTGAINGITSVNCVSEGTDIPVVSVAILMRPTLSLAMHLQQVGRALRISEGKTRAVILDHSGNTHRHGMPDTPRDWSLDTKIQQGKKSAPADQEAWRECPKCFGYIPMNETTCPQCGAEYVRKEIEMIQTIAGKLELATEEDFHEKLQKVERLKWLQSIGFDKMTDTQIREFGKLKGYRPGWAYLKIKGRKKGVAV
jgi:superfamily II DNA or RNA helicase